MFKRILIANRGEIAVRVFRACRELEIEPVVVYSQADREALHVQLAEQAYCIGPARSADSYLNVNAILTVAQAAGCDAIHPGYGFLSENADFADACEAAGITFIGPSGDVIRAMGNKAAARKLMQSAGVPVVPGSDGAVDTAEQARALADSIGYPVLIKASAGGGGRGMRRVYEPEQLIPLFEEARSESLACFGSGEMYLEKLIVNPRHIEFQIMADGQGHVIQLGDRDCSIAAFLGRHSGFCLEEVDGYEGFTRGNAGWAVYGCTELADRNIGNRYHLERAFRIMPQNLEGEGHFMAVLKKDGPDGYEGYPCMKPAEYLKGRKKEELLKEYREFLTDSLTGPEQYLNREEYVLFGGQLYLLPPDMPDMEGLKILRPGLHMGTLKKKRFEPSHGLALALKKGDVKQWIELPSGSMEVIRYLKGETLSAGGLLSEGIGKGWGLVLTDGFSLGWCKMAGGMIKNHYPKGLRWM